MKNILEKLKLHITNNYKEIIINLLIIGIFLFTSCYNFPYLIYKPGGTIPLESRIYIDGKKANLGDYNLAYVSVSRGNLLNLVMSGLIKDWEIVKEKELVIPDTDYDTTFKIEKIDMQNSINIAKYIAFQKAGKTVELNVDANYIYAIDKNAITDLKVLDKIISVDGNEFNLEQINNYLNEKEVGDEITIEVSNEGKKYTRYAKVSLFAERKLIGIYVSSIYEVKTTPSLEIKVKGSEAGSSGGLMMTLAIYDALTSKDIASGKKIVGTGTIELDGSIGSIGGVKYKLLGAQKAKADIFFIPYENYEEAQEVYREFKLKFSLVPVKNFDDVIEYLDSI